MTATETLPDLERATLTRHPRPDLLRVCLMADCLTLFAFFATAALWTSHDWLRLPDTIAAVTALIAFLRYLTTRTF